MWNEKFVFEKLKLEDLRSNRVAEITVWDLPKNTKHYDFIGGLRLGPRPDHDKLLPYADSSDTELSHWMNVMDTPGHGVEQLHTLRHNMDPRTFTIAMSEPAKEETSQTAVNEGFTTSAPEQYESTPVTHAAMVTQPSITIISEDAPYHDTSRVSPSHQSPVRTEKLKYDDDDDDANSTPSHQVIS